MPTHWRARASLWARRGDPQVRNTFRQVGDTLAVAVYGALVAGSFASGMNIGLIAGAVMLAAAAPLGITRRGAR